MNGKKIRRLFLLIPVLMILTALFAYLQYEKKHFLPDFITWNSYSGSVDFNEESVFVKLKSKKLSILKDGELLYQTADDIYVSDAFFTDINHDSGKEIIMMVWKQGSYGDHKPFWIEKDTDEYTQHIFIYRWDSHRPDRLDPVWMSSDLGMNISKISIDDNECIHLTDCNGKETSWAWLHWGLVNCD